MCPHILASTSSKLAGGRLAEVGNIWLNSRRVVATDGKVARLVNFYCKASGGRTKIPPNAQRNHRYSVVLYWSLYTEVWRPFGSFRGNFRTALSHKRNWPWSTTVTNICKRTQRVGCKLDSKRVAAFRNKQTVVLKARFALVELIAGNFLISQWQNTLCLGSWQNHNSAHLSPCDQLFDQQKKKKKKRKKKERKEN